VADSPDAAAAPATDIHAPAPLDLHTPQLTLRAVLTGMAIGGLLSACNIYTGLTVGWGINMSISSVLISYAFWLALQKLAGTRPWTMLENNINQAAASSAAAVSSAGLVAPIPALTMLTGQTLEWHWLALWVFSVCIVGITVAIPVRRQMIVVDKLAFPSGVATAQTLREMYAQGAEAVRRVMALLIAAVLAAVNTIAITYSWMLSAVLIWLGGKAFELKPWALPLSAAWFGGLDAAALGFKLKPALLMYGIGGLLGLRTCVSLLLGAIIAWGVLAPRMIERNWARLKSSEPLAVLPAGVKEQLLPEPHGYLKYQAELRTLDFRGQMSDAARESFLALSDDSRWREAVERLYVRAQFRPLAPPPAFSTTRDVQITAPLPDWPHGLSIPRQISHRFRHDVGPHRLVAIGRVEPADVAVLRETIETFARNNASGAAAAQAILKAAETLASESQVPMPQQIPADLAGVVTLDPAQRWLRSSRSLSDDEIMRLKAVAPEEKAWTSAITALQAGTQVKITPPAFRDVVEWLLWPGVTLMVVSSLVSFAMSGGAMVRALTGFGKGSDNEARGAGDVPARWFFAALSAAMVLSVALQTYLFGIAWWAAVIGVLLSFVLALVATRVAGETNTTPVGAMGKITQLTFGVIIPNNPAPNLMTANVTGGAATQCADLMQDLKTGYLIGATPWKQAVSQMMGALSGALLGSLFYLILLPNPSLQLMTTEWPAPAVATWKAVAELFMVGLDALPRGAATAMWIAGTLGVILPIADRCAPGRWKLLVPSAASLGLAFVIDLSDSLAMFLGGATAAILSWLFPKWSSRFLVVICAGLVAGESLTGVGVSIQRIFWPH
jgi:uncharacterized oligopeptide transporter (OPT) family protein